LELPIDHFRLLGVGATTDSEAVLRTLQQRLDRVPDQGFTHDTLQASEHLLIRSTGRISGKATYGEIEIERGGLVQGSVLPEGAPVTAPVVAPKFQAGPSTSAVNNNNNNAEKPSA
jgi:hypothetical protein